MGQVRPESNPANALPAEGDSHSAPDVGRRYATVDPEELRRWNRSLHEFCTDKFTPQGVRS